MDGIYKIESHKAEIKNPSITKISQDRSLCGKKICIMVDLESNGNKLFNVILGQADGVKLLSESKALDFATKQLETFKVKQ